MRGNVAASRSMFSVLPAVLFPYLHESHRSLSSFVRLSVNGLKLGYWMIGSGYSSRLMRKRTDLPRLEINMDLVIPKGNSKLGTYMLGSGQDMV